MTKCRLTLEQMRELHTLGLSMAEIAEHAGVTRQRVQQVLKRAGHDPSLGNDVREARQLAREHTVMATKALDHSPLFARRQRAYQLAVAGYSMTEMAADLGCHKVYAYRMASQWARLHGLRWPLKRSTWASRRRNAGGGTR